MVRTRDWKLNRSYSVRKDRVAEDRIGLAGSKDQRFE